MLQVPPEQRAYSAEVYGTVWLLKLMFTPSSQMPDMVRVVGSLFSIAIIMTLGFMA